MNCKHETFSNFLTSVDRELGRDQESIHIFEWIVEDRYEKRLSENHEYFSERPDLRSIQNEQILYELDIMEKYFVLKEEYEKCASIVRIRSEIKSAIS